jgi:hypothetical protein
MNLTVLSRYRIALVFSFVVTPFTAFRACSERSEWGDTRSAARCFAALSMTMLLLKCKDNVSENKSYIHPEALIDAEWVQAYL